MHHSLNLPTEEAIGLASCLLDLDRYRSLPHGHGLGIPAEAQHAGRQGTRRYACEGQHHVARDNYWKGHCVVLDATGELAGLRGRFETFMPLETMVASYKGVLHSGEE